MEASEYGRDMIFLFPTVALQLANFFLGREKRVLLHESNFDVINALILTVRKTNLHLLLVLI